ncbi:MAG: SdrD B-like domain-containing protein [Thermodesulfobacteriota bacterium]
MVNGFVPASYPTTYQLQAGLQVTLSALPGGFFTFTGWSGNVVNGPQPTVTVPLVCGTVTASFAGTFGTFSGFVWNDENEDGIRQGDEKGLYGITVSAENAARKVSVTTAADGTYLLAVRDPGPYTETFTAPAGSRFSPQGGDSQADPATGQAPPADLTAQDRDVAANAGLIGATDQYPAPVTPAAQAPKKEASGGGGCFLKALVD